MIIVQVSNGDLVERSVGELNLKLMRGGSFDRFNHRIGSVCKWLDDRQERPFCVLFVRCRYIADTSQRCPADSRRQNRPAIASHPDRTDRSSLHHPLSAAREEILNTAAPRSRQALHRSLGRGVSVHRIRRHRCEFRSTGVGLIFEAGRTASIGRRTVANDPRPRTSSRLL